MLLSRIVRGLAVTAVLVLLAVLVVALFDPTPIAPDVLSPPAVADGTTAHG